MEEEKSFFDEEIVLRYNLRKLGFNFYEVENEENLSKNVGIDIDKCRYYMNMFKNNVKEAADEIKQGKYFNKIGGEKKASIIFIGDSLTSDLEGHYNILKKVFEENKNLELIDSSVSGDTTLQVTNRWYSTVISHQFEIAFIMIGTNDCRKNIDSYSKEMISIEEYRLNITYFIKLLKSLGKIVVMNTFPYVDNEKMRKVFAADNFIYDTKVTDAYNDVIRSAAQENGAVLNDFSKILAKDYEGYPYIGDGVHLNISAQKLLAVSELKILTELL